MMRNIHSDKLQYIADLYAQEDEFLRSVRESVPLEKRHMQVSAVEGALLKFLMTLTNARVVLEIGTFAGYSTIWLARGMASRGVLYSIERSDENYYLALKNISSSDVKHKVLLFHDDAMHVLQNPPFKEMMDAVFIDGKKDQYCSYLMHVLPLLRPGGLIIADNTLLFDNVYKDKPVDERGIAMWDEMRKFNEMMANTKIFDACMLPTVSGLSLAIKK